MNNEIIKNLAQLYANANVRIEQLERENAELREQIATLWTAAGSVCGKIDGGDISENRINIHVKHSPAGYSVGQLVQVILPAAATVHAKEAQP